MQEHTAITIVNGLDLQDMQRAGDLPYSKVLDLRFAGSDARPVEEEVLLRLRNLHIDYEQLPTDMQQPDGRRIKDLVGHITTGRSAIMVLTDQPEAMTQFCRDVNVTDIRVARQSETPPAPYKQSANATMPDFRRPQAA